MMTPIRSLTVTAVLLAVVPILTHADVVVLRDGSVKTGTIEEANGAITLNTGSGPLIIATARIEVRAESMVDAYDQLAARMTTDVQRMALGRWCLKHNLLTQAEQQFQLLNNDLRQDALDSIQDRRAELQSGRTTPPPVKPSVRTTSSPRSGSDLGVRVASTYRTQIRPLLQNGCGKAACHGRASDQNLRLLRGNRQEEQQTVLALLQRIDRKSPRDSELLQYAARPHGGVATLSTDPRHYPERYQRLRTWVEQTAAADRFGGDPNRARNVGWRNGAVSR